MKINNCIEKNTVAAENQVNEKFKIFNVAPNGFKILFLGNSITLHETAPEIGWNHNWGMAASREENDYVHIVLREAEKKYGKINYCITNVGLWEQNYWKREVLESFAAAKTFAADLVIIRLGENVRRECLSEYDFKENFSYFAHYFQGKRQTIITSLFWEHEAIDSALSEACAEISGSFVDISDLGYRKENMAIGEYAHAGVAMHPNDNGMHLIAERILAKIHLK